MSTNPLDPEPYLNFHYGKSEQYQRLSVIAVMGAFAEAVIREIITPAFANQSKVLRQFFQVETHDILYTAACDLKTRWLAEGLISAEQGNCFGAFDIWVELMEGIPEDLITPGMFVPGCDPDQGDKFKQN